MTQTKNADERAFSFLPINKRESKPKKARDHRNPGALLHPDGIALSSGHLRNNERLC